MGPLPQSQPQVINTNAVNNHETTQTINTKTKDTTLNIHGAEIKGNYHDVVANYNMGIQQIAAPQLQNLMPVHVVDTATNMVHELHPHPLLTHQR